MDIKRFFLLIFSSLVLQASETCFFIPPQGWEFANPEMLAPRVHVCFLGKSSKGLSPSVNLATEPVHLSLDAYIEEVRKIHAADPNSRWRDLGKFNTRLGNGRLTELESTTEMGIARLVQLIVIKDRVAYILTASALKEEFSKYYKTFDQVLRSLQFTSNLIESLPSQSQRLALQQLVQTIESNFSNQLKQQRALEQRCDRSMLPRPFERKAHLLSTKQPLYQKLLQNLQQNLLDKAAAGPLKKMGHCSTLQPSALLQFIKDLQREYEASEVASCSMDQLFYSETFQSNFWRPFEEKIIKDFTEMGPYWQILLLRNIHTKLLTERSK